MTSTDITTCCSSSSTRRPARIPRDLVSPAADAELATFAKALAHPVRVQIIRMLARKEARMCSHIVDELPLAQSTVSEHLRILRTTGLVQANESGARTSYCIVPTKLARLKALLDAL
ncbi:MAG: hypothetical protein ABS36_06240 [Acidobacteria bacterium SCN 69-37]|nr:MAG: hypothetical protein ABS36_06240 [Acidobacteria bacterium SCN 69-37]